jgi:hypothetical protein
VYGCLRLFLQEYHFYRSTTSTFNSKPERYGKKPKTLTSRDWLWAYETKKEKEIAKLFNFNGECMLNDPKFFKPMLRKCPLGWK